MAVKNEAKSSEVKREYIFRLCPTCGVKLHTCAFICFKCGKRYNYDANSGKWVDFVYKSTNSSDAIYNRKMNDVEKCFNCWNTQNNNTCKYIYCYGSGRGNCAACKRFESTRFDCCQEIVKRDLVLINDKEAGRIFHASIRRKLDYSVLLLEKQEGVKQ